MLHVETTKPCACSAIVGLFLARTANCLWKASLDRVKPFLWFFPRWPRMSCNPFRRWSRSCPISGRSKPMCRRACKACDLQSLSDRLQKVEEGESQSQTPSPSPRPAQRASTDVLPSLPSSSRSWADRVEQEEDDDAFEHSMDLDVEPGDDAKGIRIFPLEEATESFLSPGFVLAPT